MYVSACEIVFRKYEYFVNLYSRTMKIAMAETYKKYKKG